MSGKFELYKDRKGEFRFALVAANGEKVLASEGYTTKSACKNGISSVQTNAPRANQFDRCQAKNGKHYFVLRAGNRQIIGKSQMYATPRSMENGIESVRKNGRLKGLEDRTKK